MAAQILSFAGAARLREPASRDWSRQELAEFYRVESALVQAGLQLDTERGLSDEGDPWFVFCRADTGEVFIHFARVDGGYIVDGAAFGTPARGRDFGALVRDLIASHPLANVRRPGSNVMLHPAALLIALVGAAFFHSGKAHAAEAAAAPSPAADAPRVGERRGLTFNAGGAAPVADAGRVVALDAGEVAAVMAGVAIGLRAVAAAPSAEIVPTGTGSASALADLVRAAALRDRAADGAAPPASGGLAGSGPGASLSVEDARAVLTAMAVFHDLALSAAPAAAAAVVPGASIVGPPSDAALPGTSAAAAASAAADAAPVLLVRLASGPLPQIEAVSLVTADGALAHVAPDHVTHVDALPTFLLTLISNGDVFTVAAPVDGASSADPGVQVGGGGGGGSSGPPPSGDGTSAAGPASPGAGADADHGLAVGSGVTGRPGADPATPHAAAPEVHPAAAPIALTPTLMPTPPAHPVDALPAAAPAAPAVPAIDAAVDAFVTEVPGVQVLISGHDVVFYDPAIMGVLHVGDVLDSITWRLEDGSSVSLIGTAAELHAFHGLG